MNFWSHENLAHLTAGRWLTAPTAQTPQPCGVSTDTRHIERGNVFIALRGDRFDAHDYLSQAAGAGAAMLIVDNETKAAGASTGKTPVLLVDDCIAALQAIARAWRDELRDADVRVISVCGSNGKTTTRHIIHAVLSAQFAGTQSPKSFNNHLGVPLTLLAAKTAHDFVVVEIGSNHPGEVAALAAMVRPDIAVITSIGREHMEHFKTLENVAAEEAAIIGHIRDEGTIIAPGDEPLLKPHLAATTVNTVRFGETSTCEMRLTRVAASGDGSEFDANGQTFRLPLPGRHNARNALAAIAVAQALGMSAQAIAAALADATGPPMRLAVTHIGRGTIINDAYNANPDSMTAALRTLCEFSPATPDARRVAIIGDMLELGDDGPALHREIGELIVSLGNIDRVFAIGKLAMFAAAASARHWPGGERITGFAAWQDDLPDTIAAQLREDDTVLIKASRGMALERLIPAITSRMNSDCATSELER